MARDQPEQQAPPVQRLRIRYAKRGRARFTSSRDFSRAFERALRRAGVPMAYSSGFSPHPRISYANACATGAASEAEYCEIGLTAPCDPDRVREALDTAMPAGLDVVEVWVAPTGALADRLTGSHWSVRLPGADLVRVEAALATFLGSEAVEVQRMTKNGLRSFDARGCVVSATMTPDGLDLVIAHVTPLVRPDDVLSALVAVDDALVLPDPPVLTRLSQGVLDHNSGRITDPREEAAS
ncbi:TIGR03936 family radical SAM-associated protein [Microlunatus antarcticus]|uniref:Radical SAM-linked protein n=1 Tax=Microlunatus antarcticus TaxID=53388 RepID=A0A7W5JTG9_9ACTN|nr:TIGR03936 family radical SAM-associated protein [Microlunatus antarcticus]MBB3325978.1 radical SAM-linked protein [Microlunatus antarcticus]